MNDIASPHFSSSILTWITIVLQLVVASTLINAFIVRKNRAALVIGIGTLFAALGYFAALYPTYLYPNDLVSQGWYANVVSEAVWYVMYATFSLIIIDTQFKRVPNSLSLVVLIAGLTVVGLSAYFYQPPTVIGDTYSFNRIFIADFLPFIFGVFLTIGLGKFFLSSYANKRHRRSATIITIGIGLVAIFSQLSTVIDQPGLVFYWQLIAIIGVILIQIGLKLAAKTTN